MQAATQTYPTAHTQAAAPAHTVSGKARWTGRVLSGLAILFMLFDSIIKVIQIPEAVEGTAQLGYPVHLLLTIGILALACTIIYMIPRTSVLGAILLTGYLGGAIATHVRLENPLFSHTLFPVYLGLMIWGGLFLRDARLRELLPVSRRAA